MKTPALRKRIATGRANQMSRVSGAAGGRRKQNLQVIERIGPRARRVGPCDGALPRVLVPVLVDRIQVV